MEDYCSKIANCDLFNDELLKRQDSANIYKELYCSRSDKYPICKRYIISNLVGACADYVLPNSSSSIKELVDRMIADGIIPDKDYSN